MSHIRFFILLTLVPLLTNCQSVRDSKISVSPELRNLSVRQIGESPSRFNTMSAALAWRDSQCILHQSAFDRSARVLDYYSGEEIDVKDAFYVAGPRSRESADSGIIAFRDLKSAERFRSENGSGRILTFDELITSEVR